MVFSLPLEPKYLIVVGASAGGLEAISELLSHLPQELDEFAMVVAQHLSPTYKSRLVEILSKHTSFEVLEAKDDLQLEPKKIYITPPDSEITVTEEAKIRLTKPSTLSGPKPSVDILFESAAKCFKERAIGIILSGTGNDGSVGIQKIKQVGGLTLVQEPRTAKYDGMPISAQETHKIDFILSPSKMGEAILQHILDPKKILEINSKNALKKIVELLSFKTDVDFFHYKQSTISRRISSRVQSLKLSGYAEYLDYINSHADEINFLLENLIVGVTSFFRDKEVFESLKKILLSHLKERVLSEPFRVWVPGCATGEEVYSIAIVLNQVSKELEREFTIQIFGTDIDDSAVLTARNGIYSKESLKSLPQEMLETYFQPYQEKFEVRKFLKNGILFSKHDITSNPPFLKIDLISCRNLLVYLDKTFQEKLIPLFHYSLNPSGILIIGKTENPKIIEQYFQPLDKKNKIFLKETNIIDKRRKLSGGYKSNIFLYTKIKDSSESTPLKKVNLKLDAISAILEFNEYPFIILNKNLDILELYGSVNKYLEISSGLMNSNIKKFIKPEYNLEVISAINHFNSNQTAYIGEWKQKRNKKDKLEMFRIKLLPFFIGEREQLLVMIFESHEFSLEVISEPMKTESEEIFQKNQELEKELISVKQTLQTYIEELETTNEELQTINEELQSANEELQATNEELETTNEELQSTNEELQTAYNELKSLNEQIENSRAQLKKVEANLRVLIDSSNQGFILVGNDSTIQEYNKVAMLLFQKIIGKTFSKGELIYNFIPNFDLEIFKENLKSAFLGNIVDVEKKIELDGEYKWFKFTFNPIIIETETYSVGIFILDITDKKRLAEVSLSIQERLEKEIEKRTYELIELNNHLNQEIIKQKKILQELESTQKELKLSQERYKLLASSIPSSDLILFDNNLKVLLATGEQILKTSWENVDYQGKYLEEILPSKLWDLLLSSFYSAIKGNSFESEISYEGEIFQIAFIPIFNLDKNIDGGVSILHNITSTKLWEIQSRYNENILNYILEIAPVGICLLNEELVCTIYNNKFLELLGLTKELVYKKRITEFFPPIQDINYIDISNVKTIEQVLRDNVCFEIPEKKIFIETNWSSFTTVDNKIYFLLIINDITEIKNMNLKLEQRVKEEVARNREKDHLLISQSRLASMGEMIGNIAHQWRQPLSSLSGIFQNLVDAYKYGELTDELMTKSEKKFLSVIEHMSKTIDDFRDFFHPKKDKVEFNLISDCLNKTLVILENRLHKTKVQIEIDCKNEIVIFGYPGEISQVILNILNNSFDAFEDRGIKDGKIIISTRIENNKKIFSISDNAGGIDPSIQSKIFDPYFTTKNKGTGIGLYMSKMIIEKSMYGSLEYKPISNGAKFIIVLE